MARSFVEHKPCAVCGEPLTTIMVGPPATQDPYWLCFSCYLLTPSGVALVQDQVIKLLGDTEDGIHTGQAVANHE